VGRGYGCSGGHPSQALVTGAQVVLTQDKASGGP
jgi:hypothetical protein